jgi:hypothetical protein
MFVGDARARQSYGRLSYIHNDHLAWQGHELHNRAGETTEGTATTITECMQPPLVTPLGCCPVHMETPRISRGVWSCGIQASESFDGYVADGRLSLTSLAKPIASETLHSEHGMRIQMTIISVPHLPLLRTTKFTHLHCAVDRPSEVLFPRYSPKTNATLLT